MSLKHVVAVVILLQGAGTTLGQDLPRPRPVPYTSAAELPEEEYVEQAPTPAPRLSDWILYSHVCPECCGPIGADGPIHIELYVRSGASLPVTGDGFEDAVQTGWMIQGGGRSLFFNVPRTAAWTIDLGISHTFNNGNRSDIQFALPTGPVSVRDLHRTFANIAIGREHFCQCKRSCEGGMGLRFGWDIGGRWGSARLDLNDPGELSGFRRQGSEAGGFFGALHADVELPHGCCIWLVGLRGEVDNTYTDFENFIANEIWDVNFLATLGVRY